MFRSLCDFTPGLKQPWAGINQRLRRTRLFELEYRILLWGRFLFRTSRLNLRLIAAHPDGASGLRFLNSAIFAFMPFAFTLGVITAGTVANRVAHARASLDRIEMTLLGLVVVVLVLVAGPLIVFVFNLHRQKLVGTFRYGLLAQQVGRDLLF